MTSGSTRQVESRHGRAGPSALSSSSRHTPKRQKLAPPEQLTLSKYFPGDVSSHKRAPAVPSTSKSMHLNLATAEAIIIDEEYDTPTTNDDPHDSIVVGTSSPDPVDFLNPKPSYAFDQKKPTPMDQFSASWEEEHKSPQRDGTSTQRVRRTMMDMSRKMESKSVRPDSDGDGVQQGRSLLSGRSNSTTRTEVPSGQGNVKAKVALYEGGTHYLDLLSMNRPSRKNGMKPKQVGLLS